MPIPPRTPAECFSTILLWLSRAVDGHSMWGRLARPMALLILDRIRAISHHFARISARIGAGTYVPRRSATPRPHTTPKPRRPNPLPQSFMWLVKLVPEAAVYGSQLQYLFRDPEMAALLAAAPAPMRRPLRSLCRMLGVTPPPILALPAPPPMAPAPPGAPAARRQAPKPLPSPASPPRTAPAPAPPAQACGPPFPA